MYFQRKGSKEALFREISFRLNGEPVRVRVRSDQRLIDLLRDTLGLRGTKEGCGRGDCGSCTVILNGLAVTSCLVLAATVEGAEILTVESLFRNGRLDPLQEAFLEKGAVQCGYCTPGLLMSAKALLLENPHPSLEEIKIAVSGNLCRCTGYKKIFEAIQLAAER
ncbi:(2Fe-2S)-binding protein [Candidatus Hakubella thermalkaliphila]|nr:(2Fe-2S)-binding protein [Candidatus Hakubella thermalkaliphila]GFP27307.1 aerobic carbon-monoxide dehydrogenase small subunit [Candidatus Hakubella thermalkaliphila]